MKPEKKEEKFDNIMDQYIRKKDELLKSDLFEFPSTMRDSWNENLGNKEEVGVRLLKKIENGIVNKESHYKFRMGTILKVAAVILVLLLSGFFIWQRGQKEFVEEIAIVAKYTESGQKLNITLSDGTYVKLNSKSKLIYPQNFSGETREVELIGEAFFKVARNGRMPFVVKSGDIATTVLGTEFNVNAFTSNNVSTISLAEGKVKVELLPDKKTVFLEPGYAAIINKQKQEIETEIFDPEQNVGWKDGLLKFKNSDETVALEKLEAWFGVRIKVTNKSPKKWFLTSKFRNESLDDILRIIGHQMKFEYEIADKEVTITYLKNK